MSACWRCRHAACCLLDIIMQHWCIAVKVSCTFHASTTPEQISACWCYTLLMGAIAMQSNVLHGVPPSQAESKQHSQLGIYMLLSSIAELEVVYISHLRHRRKQRDRAGTWLPLNLSSMQLCK